MSVHSLALATGFSREAIDRRIVRFELDSENFSPKEVLQLKPLNNMEADKLSLEEARTNQAIEDTALKRAQRMKIEGDLAPVEELQAEVTELLDGMGKIIAASPLDEDRKEDILGQMKEFVKERWK